VSKWGARLSQALAEIEDCRTRETFASAAEVSQVSLVARIGIFQESVLQREVEDQWAVGVQPPTPQSLEIQKAPRGPTLETVETQVPQVLSATLQSILRERCRSQPVVPGGHGTVSERWILLFENGEVAEVGCCPAARRQQILDRFRDAVDAEPIDPPAPVRLPPDIARMFDACVGAGFLVESERQVVTAMAACDEVATRSLMEELSAPIGRCARCVHHARPGLADSGYCSGRSDRPHVYGLLYELPVDEGATCDLFREVGVGAAEGPWS